VLGAKTKTLEWPRRGTGPWSTTYPVERLPVCSHTPKDSKLVQLMDSNDGLRDVTPGAQPADYFRVVRERKWIILAVVIVAVGLATAYSLYQTPVYQASADLLRETAALDQTLFGTSVFQFQDAGRQLQTGASLVKIDAIGRMVKADLGSTRSVQSLLAMVGVTALKDSDIIRISVKSSSPQEAAAVADSFAGQFIKYRQEANRSILAATDEKVMTELSQMTPAELETASAATLKQKHEELGILQAMQTGGYELVQQASTPSSPTSPRPVRNAGFALIGGLFLGVLLAFLIDYLDRRIKGEDVMEQEFGLPVLASVPQISRHWTDRSGQRSREAIGFTDDQSQFLESFRTLRSSLRFYQLNQKSQTLLITSGLPQEGKTVTVVNLAFSLALSGARVIVLEADLRRPMLHQYLGLDNGFGVSDVLAGAGTFTESLQMVRVPDFVSHAGDARATSPGSTMQGEFLCMTSGPLPPNPAELLSSSRMGDLMAAAAESADYVLIDTPPVLLVSDALNLADQTDGVIVAARMRETRIEEAREVRTILERSGCRVLGLVVNGVSRKRGAYYRGRYEGYFESAGSTRA
jgi:polysaccharide biosynthesis transport protein